MKRFAILAMLSTFVLLAICGAWAQPGSGRAGRGGGLHYGKMWDANSVTTVAGEVAAVEQYSPGKGGPSYGLRLIVRTDKETLTIILGPGWYIEKQPCALAAKDQVEVKGSRISVQGQPMIIAAEVKKGSQVLKLRDDQGNPLWR